MNSGLLTIDDFPSANAPALVDYFSGIGIRVIFFATGENLEAHYAHGLYALRKGMLVGNHSWSHPGFSSLTLEEGIAEIERCERILDRLYRDAGVPRLYRPFRFPYGDKGGENRAALQQYLREHGFNRVADAHIRYSWWHHNGLEEEIDTFWTFDFREYALYQEPGLMRDYVWQRMHDPAPAQGAALFGPDNRHILLMHDHAETEAVLPGYYRMFTEHLLENGFVFDAPSFV